MIHRKGDLRNEYKKSWILLLCFAMLCIIQASWFLIRTGPLTIPDPDMHATAAYALATGQSLNATRTELDDFGNPGKVQTIRGESGYLYLEGRKGVLVDNALLLSLSGDPYRTQQRASGADGTKIVSVPSEQHPNRSNQYFPLLYAPQALGLRVGLWLNTSPYTGWQLSRIGNLVAFVVLWGFAILLIPRGKLFLTLIGSLPTTVFLASSLMVDAMVCALCACFVALLARYAHRHRPLTYTQMAWIIMLSWLVLCSKIVYAPMLLVTLILPRSVLSGKGKLAVVAAWGAGALLIFVPWYLRFSGTLALTNVADNISFIRTHLGITTSAVFRTFRHLPVSLSQSASIELFLVFNVWLLAMPTVVVREHDSISRGYWIGRNRYLLLSVGSITASLVCMMLFLAITWNDMSTLGTAHLEGFQERYLIPLMPVAAFGLIRDKPSIRDCACHVPEPD
ncbi:MAG: DUF2142 domain-containing protein [Bifidobacterium psychraerophilum]|uniref:DUF2142 domain-containing protein n=1 Tax=Bifidobacterium psychraerophilum TaxID=218140 RepID=UPI0039EACE87